MRVLLDTNVVLDSMLQRAPLQSDADAILKAAALGQISCAVTSLSLATIFYVGRKVVGTAKARADVRSYLAAFTILPIDKQTLLDADALAGSDFEDNITMAAAAARCTAMPNRSMAKCLYAPFGSASGPHNSKYDTRITARAPAVSRAIVAASHAAYRQRRPVIQSHGTRTKWLTYAAIA